MRIPTGIRLAAAAAASVCLVGLTGLAVPVQAKVADVDAACVTADARSDSARGGRGPDHRDVSATEQRAITRDASAIVQEKGEPVCGTRSPGTCT